MAGDIIKRTYRSFGGEISDSERVVKPLLMGNVDMRKPPRRSRLPEELGIKALARE